MISAIDTNVLVALWDRDDTLNSAAQSALDAAFARGTLVISGAVFAELLAFPRRTENFLDEFLEDTGIAVDWSVDESVWRVAGNLFRSTQIAAANREQVNHAVFWRTFSLALMLWRKATACSRLMMASIAPPFPNCTS
jgi:predicted nucleic acid-binding protein